VPKLVTEGITTKLVELIPGVKNSMSLNLVNNNITVQDAECGFSPAGDVQMIQRELRVYPKAVNDILCQKDFEQRYFGMFMRSNKELPFERIFAESYLNRVNRWNEHFIWDGDGTVDGLVKVIADEQGVVNAASAVNSASGYIAKLNALMTAAPTEVKTSDEGIVFCDFNFFDGYMNELRAANLYISANQEYANGGYMITIPGTNRKLVATEGMSSMTNNTIATGSALVYTMASNIVIGTDMDNNAERFDMWYSRDFDQYRVNIQWKIGAQIRFPEYVVKGYTLV
jgi:hypothetical protein